MTGQQVIRRAVASTLAVVLTCAAGGPLRGQVLPPPRMVEEPSAGVAKPAAPAALGLEDLINLSLERNPTLRQAESDIQAAQGRALQAGLYPNPTFSVIGEEIGRRGGIHTPAQISQEIVTGGKLGLSRAVAGKEVDQQQLALLRQRHALFTTVRQGYFEVLTLQRRIEVLTELAGLATRSFENAQKLLEAQQIARLDLLQFEVELNRLRADREAAEWELIAARQRLAAGIGVPDLPCVPLLGDLGAPLPNYDFCQVRSMILELHPEVKSAQVGVSRAQLALQRAEVEACPNVTVSGGYQRNFNDRENEARYEVSVPIPVFNRNQGNIHAAQAAVGRAIQEVGRVQYDLSNRLAAAVGTYSAARARADRYRNQILPQARESYRLALGAFKGGQFDYLRVLQAQRAAAEANLEYLRALGDAWRGASEIAGLLLEERWPISILGPCDAPASGRIEGKENAP